MPSGTIANSIAGPVFARAKSAPNGCLIPLWKGTYRNLLPSNLPVLRNSLSRDDLDLRFDAEKLSRLMASLPVLREEAGHLANAVQKSGRPRDLAEERWILEVADIFQNAFGQPTYLGLRRRAGEAAGKVLSSFGAQPAGILPPIRQAEPEANRQSDQRSETAFEDSFSSRSMSRGCSATPEPIRQDRPALVRRFLNFIRYIVKELVAVD